MTDFDKEEYLTARGWLQNTSGWWHPPLCLASWPLQEAFEMAHDDEQRMLHVEVTEGR